MFVSCFSLLADEDIGVTRTLHSMRCKSFTNCTSGSTIEGTLKNCVYFSGGLEKTTCILTAPAITGETSVIDGGTSVTSAQAITDVEVCIISPEASLEYLYAHPAMIPFLLNNYARKIRALQLQACSIVLNVSQRVARMLVNFDSYGIFYTTDSDVLHITHDQLADFLGITRPKVTRALSEFEKANLIKKGRGTIQILDYDGLRSIYE